ncbi:hypothetical protein H4Q26_007540 [Puccinia striiformis f. sp. tritici PST-130]|nr:hypothetical protein H4Q26_007540 [Puccinia striiformis f. sp. tritici PST-130]
MVGWYGIGGGWEEIGRRLVQYEQPTHCAFPFEDDIKMGTQSWSPKPKLWLGLPSNPIIALSWISSTFRDTLAQKVRSLNFKLSSSSTSIAGSMGKGGGSAICGILRSCPLLKSITIDTAFLSSCKEPMMEALSTQRCIQEFCILNDQKTGPTEIQWLLEEMNARLSLRWDMLNTVELSQLSGRSFTMAEDIHKSIPVFNRALRTIALNDPDLDKRELYSLW